MLEMPEPEHRSPRWMLYGFAALLVALACIQAYFRWLWFDELLTFQVSALGRFPAVYSALRAGADFSTPFFYLIEGASTALFGQNAFAIRLPSILGFLLASICIYHYVRRRLAANFAVMAALIPLLTAARDYSVDARPYGMLLGFSAAALLSWQSCAGTKWRPFWLGALCVSLGATISCHYYGMIAVCCLAIAEAYRWVLRHRIDWPVLIAFAVGALPLVLLRDLILENKRLLATYFGRLWWGQLPEFYQTLLLPATVAALLVMIALLLFRRRDPSHIAQSSMPPEEIFAAALFAGLALIAILFAGAFTGVFLFRYALGSVIGIAILTAYFASRYLERRMANIVVLIIAGVLLSNSLLETRRSIASRRRGHNPEEVPFQPAQPYPVVIEDLRLFLPDVFYGAPGFGNRAYYLTSEQLGLQYEGSNTNDHIMNALALKTHLNVVPFESFLRANQTFYLYCNEHPSLAQPVSSEGAHVGWQLHGLLDKGYHVEIVDQTGTALLLLVTTRQSL